MFTLKSREQLLYKPEIVNNWDCVLQKFKWLAAAIGLAAVIKACLPLNIRSMSTDVSQGLIPSDTEHGDMTASTQKRTSSQRATFSYPTHF